MFSVNAELRSPQWCRVSPPFAALISLSNRPSRFATSTSCSMCSPLQPALTSIFPKTCWKSTALPDRANPLARGAGAGALLCVSGPGGLRGRGRLRTSPEHAECGGAIVFFGGARGGEGVGPEFGRLDVRLSKTIGRQCLVVHPSDQH